MTNKVKEKMKVIYENFINGMPLTAANLRNWGISTYNINQFIENGLLIRAHHGYYELGNGEDYYAYCKSLFLSGKQNQGVKGINMGKFLGFFSDDDIIDDIIRDILKLLDEKKLLEASRLFITLMNVNLSWEQEKYRMGLYLFSMVTELPEEYVEIAADYRLIVGSLWLQRWQEMVKKIKDTPDDSQNSFDKLLMNLGSLALQHIKEYEVETINISVDSIYQQLLNKNIDGALGSLRSYLTKVNKREYEAFLVALIKIDMADEDFTFIRTISILSLVSKDAYSFNAEAYIRSYYDEKRARREKVSNLYLEILRIANDNGWALKLPRDIQLAITQVPATSNDATLKFTYPSNN